MFIDFDTTFDLLLWGMVKAGTAKGLIIVQARMGSSRFPGKSLTRIGDKPLLGHTLEALKEKFQSQSIIIATSNEPSSDPIVEFGKELEIEVYRGDENNVASRFRDILNKRISKNFCRISGDSPFIDGATIEKAFQIAEESDVDLVSTVGAGYPSGFNVEVLKSDLFQEIYPKFVSNTHLEHVTKFFYENERDFTIFYLKCPVLDGRNYKFSVDTFEDKERMNLFYLKLNKKPYLYSIKEKCELYSSLFGEKSC